MQPRVGIATDQEAFEARLVQALGLGANSLLVTRSEDALWESLRKQDLDVVILDASLLDADSLTNTLRAMSEAVDVILMTDVGDAEARARWLAAGAVASLPREISDASLQAALQRLVGREAELARRRLDPSGGSKESSLSDFVQSSPAMRHCIDIARRVVPGARALMILGETGVGKERLARSLHAESPRSGPFVTVNCGALPEALLESELFGHEEGAFTGASRARRGYFELADRGTIFLDEIGEMPIHLQVKLLRVVEERRIQRVGGERLLDIDVRIMTATNRDLKHEMEAKRFRADLFYRLAVVSLTVPPLRERREDILGLAEVFLRRFRSQFGRPRVSLSSAAQSALVEHDWPGNVRELMNVIERAVMLAREESLTVDDLRGGEAFSVNRGRRDLVEGEPAQPAGAADDGSAETLTLAEARRRTVASFESEYLERLLTRFEGRVGRSARAAGVSERTLYALMKRHGYRKEDFKS